MTKPHSPIAEVRNLADAVFDRQIDEASLERLQFLLLSDISCLQAYLERIDFHGELRDRAMGASAPEQSMRVTLENLRIVSTARRPLRLWLGYSALLASFFIILLAGWEVLSGTFHRPVGNIINLSDNARGSNVGSLELSQVIRRGSVVSIADGFLSLQLPHVLVDLQAPTTIRIHSQGEVELVSGTLNALVSKGGEGFHVRTADALVTDLGTEFMVEYSVGKGTHVSVNRGRAEASLLDWKGQSTKTLEVTAGRAARFDKQSAVAKETEFQPEKFQAVERNRGKIRSITGDIRTCTQPPQTLTSDQMITANHLLVIPEQQSVILDQALVVNGKTIPAGTRLSSYLVHYNPTADAQFAPRGSITFMGRIAAVAVESRDLNSTDTTFGLSQSTYEKQDFRELELDEDEIQLSDDQRTISFFFGMSPPTFLDEVRVFVLSDHD